MWSVGVLCGCFVADVLMVCCLVGVASFDSSFAAGYWCVVWLLVCVVWLVVSSRMVVGVLWFSVCCSLVDVSAS